MCGPGLPSPEARRVALHRRRDSAIVALARTLWRVLDAIDYRVMQARLWGVDALYGPEPETEADRRRARAREPWRSGLDQPRG
jgi:hypothetical protein